MTETVYADVLFMINFSMDVLSLYIAAKITSQKVYALRLAAGGAIGGIYGVLSLFVEGGRLISLPLTIVVGTIVVAVGLGCRAGRGFILSSILFFVAGGTLSGIMTAVMSISGRIDNGGGVELSPRAFALCAAVSAALTLFSGKVCSFTRAVKKVELRISDGNAEFCCEALVDSGNLVREPISGRPCIIVRASDVRELIPDDLYREVTEGDSDMSRLSGETLIKTRLVPIKGVGESRMMLAFRPKLIEINEKGEMKRVDALLIVDGKDESGKYGNAAAIVPSSIL